MTSSSISGIIHFALNVQYNGSINTWCSNVKSTTVGSRLLLYITELLNIFY